MKREEPVIRGMDGAAYYAAMNYFRRRSAMLIGVGVMLYICSLIPVIVLSIVGSTLGMPIVTGLGVGGMFLFIGIATALVVWNSCSKPKHSDPPEIVIDMYNRKKNSTRPVLKAFDASFWTIVAAAYLLLSFLTGRWDITWIIFIAAPAASGIVHAIANKK